MHELHDKQDAEAESVRSAASAQVTGHPTPEATDDGMKVTFQRPPKRPDPRENLKGAVKEASMRAEWGAGEDGYKRPKTPADKLRKNVPYKVRVATLHGSRFA